MNLDEQEQAILSKTSSIEYRVSDTQGKIGRLREAVPRKATESRFANVTFWIAIATAATVILNLDIDTTDKGLLCGFASMALVAGWSRLSEALTERQNYKTSIEHADALREIEDLENQIKIYNEALQELTWKRQKIAKQRRDWWIALDGWSFEKEVAIVFQSHGYTANVTKGSNDGGIDINLYKNNKRTIVQCKNHKNAIGPSPLRDLLGTLVSTRANSAIMVSRSGYTSGARQYANDNGIIALDIGDIIEMHKRI